LYYCIVLVVCCRLDLILLCVDLSFLESSQIRAVIRASVTVLSTCIVFTHVYTCIVYTLFTPVLFTHVYTCIVYTCLHLYCLHIVYTCIVYTLFTPVLFTHCLHLYCLHMFTMYVKWVSKENEKKRTSNKVPWIIFIITFVL